MFGRFDLVWLIHTCHRAERMFAIANYCSLHSLSFGQALGKLQGKVVTHSEEVGWWRTLMVECVTLFFDYIVHMGLQIKQAS